MARNYGPIVIDKLKETLQTLLGENNHQTYNGRQRTFAEVFAGLVKGSKYWTFSQVREPLNMDTLLRGKNLL